MDDNVPGKTIKMKEYINELRKKKLMLSKEEILFIVDFFI